MQIEKNLQQLFLRYQEEFMDYGGIDILDVNESGMGEDTLLHLAVSHHDCKDVELLLKNGANVNAKGDLGLTPLHLASAKGKVDIVKILLSYGARKNLVNDFDETPLDWAINAQQNLIISMLR